MPEGYGLCKCIAVVLCGLMWSTRQTSQSVTAIGSTVTECHQLLFYRQHTWCRDSESQQLSHSLHGLPGALAHVLFMQYEELFHVLTAFFFRRTPISRPTRLLSLIFLLRRLPGVVAESALHPPLRLHRSKQYQKRLLSDQPRPYSQLPTWAASYFAGGRAETAISSETPGASL